ncbi:hypothetical protein M413DRAFT_321065 [Hebeloma cylindrosporum]|uniref:Uncharacterized protein n=1 Tax=Hebeloma cylindrosporum TaxID=76867 RepID=A0A0C3BVU0_HEBCY|nr:hypothetical protein M413DRAFT_321065 [Hebeloma cylindrosporum h7]
MRFLVPSTECNIYLLIRRAFTLLLAYFVAFTDLDQSGVWPVGKDGYCVSQHFFFWQRFVRGRSEMISPQRHGGQEFDDLQSRHKSLFPEL